MMTTRVTKPKGIGVGLMLSFGFGILIVFICATVFVSFGRVSYVNESLRTINDINALAQRYAINFRGGR